MRLYAGLLAAGTTVTHAQAPGRHSVGADRAGPSSSTASTSTRETVRR
ncbi:MAG: hypothetical protein U0610_31090 [bacterium]